MKALTKRTICTKCGALSTRRGMNRHRGSLVCETRQQEAALRARGMVLLAVKSGRPSPIAALNEVVRRAIRIELDQNKLPTVASPIEKHSGFLTGEKVVRSRSWVERDWATVAQWIDDPTPERTQRVTEAAEALIAARHGDREPLRLLVALIILGS